MKRSVTRKEDVCDRCGRSGNLILDMCLVCGREYCFMCEAIMPGCMIRLDVCKDCGERNDVKNIVDRRAKELARSRDIRDLEIKQLPKPTVRFVKQLGVKRLVEMSGGKP